MVRFIFITGGVVSSLGKGIATAVLGALLQAHGFKIRLRKIDPYLNIDPGTMNPFEHGEVFVTDDGAETDLDLGHYERFTSLATKRTDNITMGQIYLSVLQAERSGEYLGQTVQIIPHVTDKIKEFIYTDITDEDFVIYEVGGTVGDIESLPTLEALRQLHNELSTKQSLFLHVTLVPHITPIGELKTKPTQHSVRTLQSMGICPSILLCRSERTLSCEIKQKLALFCNVREECVITAPNVEMIYQTPLVYHREGLDTQVLHYFGIEGVVAPSLVQWYDIVDRFTRCEKSVNVAIVGKYIHYRDSYISLVEALRHAGLMNNLQVRLQWYEASTITFDNVLQQFRDIHAILVPGGFGVRGTEGMIQASRFARLEHVPYLGICFGMQMAVIDTARHLAGLKDAGSTEFGPTTEPVISLVDEWVDNQTVRQQSTSDNKGGTMRLGGFDTILQEGTHIHHIYGRSVIRERHRHRYEVNKLMMDRLADTGLVFSGLSAEDSLPEVIEIQDHPWFIGVQYHPELQSTPFSPHPLFTDFIRAAAVQANVIP